MLLTEDDCLVAIKRCIYRRVIPAEIYSDNSTIFLGTKGELEFRLATASHEVEDLIATFGKENNITWLTFPPITPIFGGLWETAVKSLKRHMYRSIRRTKLFIKDFTLLMTKIEAILNSRPITSVSNDSNDALTPGHFLIGRPITALPEPKTIGKENFSMTRQKKRMDNLIRNFWKKWPLEYLSNLQQREKRQTGKTSIDMNDVVKSKEENTPPTLWPMGRTTKFFDRK